MAELRDFQRKTINDFECLVAAGAHSVIDFDLVLGMVPR
jgi:hypothetical protein